MKLALSAVAVMLLLGCGGPQQPAADEQQQVTTPDETVANPELVDNRAKLAELDQQIRSMVGMAYAENIEQCRLAEVGHRPCGGPQYYMAYSTATVDEAVLQELINEHLQLQIAYQRDHDIVGTCEVIPRPAVTLQGGRCVAVSASDR
ncbi:hypothetical protein [Pseudidiomarina insulisalsae]|uniref:Uncharacterized protein n=1 Tax=Pseudidiomarina insulisalsae TaxID=575789 RepID=A0A432YLG0_9GAMM|nr:hypothetical protein [Pseudidiomarina insulisalsae]RUO61821.1 hypothetical protein CWI71_05525 [Pseudidiomarina insulisalsae]